MEEAHSPYTPATEEDAKQLHASRATLWPSVWFTIALIVAIIVLCGMNLGWTVTLIAVLIVAIVGLTVLIGFGIRHGMSAEDTERCKKTLPGHDIFKEEDVRITAGKSYDYACRPSELYPYIAQMNMTKAGFYSFQHLERFFGFHIRNDYTIRPEWQQLKVGDWMYYHQNGAGTGVVDFKENEYITTYSDTRYKPTQPLAIAWRPKWMKGFAWTWNFIFEPSADGEHTHFVSYLQAWWPKETSKLTYARLMVQWGLPSIFMMNGMAGKMGRLAEADACKRRAGKR